MPSCPVCDAKVPEGSHIETYVSYFNNQEYKLYHCPTCDLQWWEPLKIIPEFYEQEQLEAYSIFHMGINEKIGENHEYFFKYMPIKSGRLLDVGCGDGVFLKKAEELGYEVWGIDFDRKSIEVCQKKRALKNTFTVSLEKFAEYCKKEGLKFDVITFFEVLEHQDKPKEFLSIVRSMLKPNGWIAGSVPNRDSWLFRKLSRKIPEMDFPPHHLLRFSMISLRNTLELSDFIIDNISPIYPTLKTIESDLQVYLAKDITKRLRKVLTGHDYGGEGAIYFKSLPTYKKYIFKSLKLLKHIAFLPITLPIKFTTQGKMIYFQCKLH